jgi:hypothetical protein
LYCGKCTGKRDFTLFISAQHVPKFSLPKKLDLSTTKFSFIGPVVFARRMRQDFKN